MDILLTPEEMDAALIEGGKKYLALIEAVNEQRKDGKKAVYPNEYHVKAEVICRVQVRQFQLWLMTHWQSAKKLDGCVQLTISESDWAAFKAAGGEE